MSEVYYEVDDGGFKCWNFISLLAFAKDVANKGFAIGEVSRGGTIYYGDVIQPDVACNFTNEFLQTQAELLAAKPERYAERFGSLHTLAEYLQIDYLLNGKSTLADVHQSYKIGSSYYVFFEKSTEGESEPTLEASKFQADTAEEVQSEGSDIDLPLVEDTEVVDVVEPQPEPEVEPELTVVDWEYAETLNKKALDKYAAKFDIQLDRRKSRENMLKEFKKEWGVKLSQE